MSAVTARQWISYSIRSALAHALYYAGVLSLWQRVALRNKAVVLMYHRVLTEDERRQTASQPGLIVNAATFARQMTWLKRRFTVLSLAEFSERLLSRRPFDGSCCLITFDDGWNDNFRHALPILRRSGMPAAVFLPVNLIGSHRLFTREALTHLLVAAVHAVREDPARRGRLAACLAPLALDGVLDTNGADPLAAVVKAVEKHRFASGPAFESAVSALSGALGSDALPALDMFIDWAQVGNMARDGIAFGGHGAEHRVLDQVPPETAAAEIETSKRVLDQRLAEPPVAFAYPGGGVNAQVRKMVQQAGYKVAFTIEPGSVSCDDDPLAVRRINIHEDMTSTEPMFMARVVGLF